LRLQAFEISKTAFQQKRKKIRTSLSSIISETNLEEIGIDSNLRADSVTPQQYLKIAEFLK